MLISRKKKKGFFASMIAKYFNNPYIFPNLSLFALKNYAARWEKMFSDIPIKSIKLYHKQPQYEFGIKSIYAVIFEVDKKIDLLAKTNQDLKDKYYKWRYSMGYLDQANDIEEFASFGIDASFSSVYKSNPPDNFMQEWYFISIAVDNIDDEASVLNMRVMMDESYWILYRNSTYRDRDAHR
jgi:hypothetical protein